MKGNFNSIINSGTPVLVDFFAEWCGPCKTQSPILIDVTRTLNGKIKVIKIDVDKNPEIAARYQVRGVPTLALFKNGQTVWRQSGVMDKNTLIHTLNNYL
ncbi:MAG: thioredoxin [Bacteroidota bacterium]